MYEEELLTELQHLLALEEQLAKKSGRVESLASVGMDAKKQKIEGKRFSKF